MRGDMRWQQMIEMAFWTPQEVGINLECYDTSHRKGSKSGYRIEQQMHYDANSRIHRRSWCSILQLKTQMDLVSQILRYYEKGGFTETDDDWLV